MSRVGPEGRSFEKIRREDLLLLADIAEADRKAFFAGDEVWAVQYRDCLIATALCQGAALHYLDGKTGVNDFDVYSFFARHPARPWCAIRNQPADFGNARFGQTVNWLHFVGRRVDLMGRSLDVSVDADPAAAIQEWLRAGRHESSAQYLSDKAVVLLTPKERIGEVVWPVEATSS